MKKFLICLCLCAVGCYQPISVREAQAVDKRSCNYMNRRSIASMKQCMYIVDRCSEFAGRDLEIYNQCMHDNGLQ